jgi:LmbE family N-acetylglucosaminyl deacetylase
VRLRLLLAALLVAATLLAGCRDAPKSPDGKADPLAAAAEAIVRGACEGSPTAPVPTWREPAREGSFDVVVYTAHPDDEAMYAGGTMDRLVRAGHRVAFVTMSHGEGGRLLERGQDGGIIERRDYPRAHVVAVRDREIAEAARRIGVAYAHLYPADANVDYRHTTSCSEALSEWDKHLPGGVHGALRALVADLRTRRPRVVITLDPRDDPQASHHGHHKAAGTLALEAARLAADPKVEDGREPHVVEEVLTTAPLGERADVKVPVHVAARIAMLDAYASQFVPEQVSTDPIAQRPTDDFVLRWRAAQAPAPKEHARLLELVGAAPVTP